MDSFDNPTTIIGSRRPILVPALREVTSSSTHPPSPPSAASVSSSTNTATSRRRKPAFVYRSPTADASGEWEADLSTRRRVSPPYSRITPRQASTSTDTSGSSSSSASIREAIQRQLPLLSIYHPLGQLAQSLPRLDATQYGLPSAVSVDDPDEQGDGTVQSASRARRGGPKPRDAQVVGEDDLQSAAAPNGTTKDTPDTVGKERNPSSRKRRGGGPKRKRKDTDDGDSVFPPPPKRTRNPRGAAANSSAPAAPSPLVGPAVVASDLLEDMPENSGETGEDAQEEPQAPKRSTRAKKPRTRPAKRRDSSGSASTSTSVSVSIAAATKAATDAKETHAPAVDEQQPQGDEAVHQVNGFLDKHEEEETGETPAPPSALDVERPSEVPPKLRDDPSSSRPSATAPLLPGPEDIPTKGMTPAPPAPLSPPLPSPQTQSATVPPAHADLSPPKPTIPTPTPTALQKEEREEGELSDDQ